MQRKWIKITLLCITVLAGTTFIYLKLRKSRDFEPLIKQKLAELVSDVSKGLYHLNIEHIEIDITNSSVTAKNIELQPDSLKMLELERTGQLGNDVFRISLKTIHLEGLSPVDLLDKKNINLDLLKLESPQILVQHKKRSKEKADTAAAITKMAKLDQSFKIERLLLSNIGLTIHDLDNDKKITSFKNLSAYLEDIQIDSTVMKDSTRFLFAKDALVYMKEYSFSPAGKKYTLGIDSVALRPKAGIMRFFNIRLQPIGTKDEFSEKLKKIEDRYDISFNEAEIKNVNWFDLITEKGFYGEAMKIKGGYISIYDDKRLPIPESKLGKYPHQLLMKIKFPIRVDSIHINDIKVIYEELNPKTKKIGKVEFDAVNAVITNITNVPAVINSNPLINVQASSKFLNKANLLATFSFDMSQVNKGVFTVDATLDKMNGLVLNQITEPLALLKINSLEIEKLKAHIKGSDTEANGEVSFIYNDLSVDLLKKDDEGKMKKRGFLSFIANKFVINQKSKEPAKAYTVKYARDPQRSFFNLIWKSLLDGIKQSVKN